MRKFIFAASLLLAAAGIAQAADTVTLPKPVPYAADNDIAGNIKRECKITEQLPDFIAQAAKAHGIDTTFADSVNPQMPGRVLDVEITDAVSEGNAWIGHHKSTSVRGKLYQDGKLIGSFRGKRYSMGGMFAGYKGSCSVLGRTVEALGKDIGTWLVTPTMDADLGDLK
ncbi:MAG TPA: hypothetical protein VFK08_05640 [Rhodanobacteraceae bacterium]|jgi:hypothetical protein|nr:hypothetical protein [Rhodanobacteraceae bacterium]